MFKEVFLQPIKAVQATIQILFSPSLSNLSYTLAKNIAQVHL